MNSASLLSAAAASLAAVLAAINLYVLGRRERHSWLRETLISEYATYLDASFSATSKAREYLGTSSDEPKRGRYRSELADQVLKLHGQQMHTLTRLRLLATAEVVRAAGQVHAADHEVIDLLSGAAGHANNAPLEAARKNAYAQREAFIHAARKSMKIPGEVAKVERV